MKAIISFSILFFLCGIDSSGTGIQKRNKPTQADSISDNSIKIKGKSNTVKIIIDSTEWNNIKSNIRKPNDLNRIEINGESNSVVINQKEGDKVNTIQNGTHNQINISQSKSSPPK